jgi:prepilin-type N-terminal cleavage/methylation domain-containing protein
MRAGSTLIELLVAIAVLGVGMAVAAISFRDPAPSLAADRIQLLAAARHAAVEGRQVVHLTLKTDSGIADVTAFPDGRVSIGGGNPTAAYPEAP